MNENFANAVEELQSSAEKIRDPFAMLAVLAGIANEISAMSVSRETGEWIVWCWKAGYVQVGRTPAYVAALLAADRIAS